MKLGWLVNSLHADVFLALACQGDVVCRPHPHERIHLHAEGLLDSERHVSGEISLAIEQARQRGTRNPESGRRCRDRQAYGLDNLGPDEVSGMGRVLKGMALAPSALMIVFQI